MKIFIGKVTGTKMAKTATVKVERVVTHKLYKKRLKRVTVYHVHDEEGKAKVGDSVNFAASKPYSKTVRWAIVDEKKGKTK